MTPYRVIMITVPDATVASRLAKGLVSERLAACVNIVPAIQSVYWWQGEIQTDNECLLICKTLDTCVARLTQWVLENHPYEVPEVVALPIEQGNAAYLHWIVDSLEK